MTKITDEIKIKINEFYASNHNYSATARELGISPSTVKKYVDPNYTPIKDLQIIHIDLEATKKKVEDFVLDMTDINPSSFLVLSEEERNEIKELWKELSI